MAQVLGMVLSTWAVTLVGTSSGNIDQKKKIAIVHTAVHKPDVRKNYNIAGQPYQSKVARNQLWMSNVHTMVWLEAQRSSKGATSSYSYKPFVLALPKIKYIRSILHYFRDLARTSGPTDVSGCWWAEDNPPCLRLHKD